MTSVLSPDEIDRLLAAVDAANAADNKETGETSAESRPEKFTREQIRAISLLHEKFARAAAVSLSSRLGVPVQMTAASVDQLSLGELYRTIPVPTTLGVITMEPLQGSAILEIAPAITFAILSKIGGPKEKAAKPRQEPTENEKYLLESVYALLLGNLRESWSGVIALRPRLDRIETDPKFIKIAPPAEMTALITLDAKIGGTAGMLNLCIPHPVIAPVLEKLMNS
jgi:flagellar motor switch protein FliM